MERIEEFVDERQKELCIYCGALLVAVETNKDHVPSKGLLLKPHPENLPVVRVCKGCNSDFSVDEEYLFLFLRCVLAGTTNPDDHRDARVAGAMKRHVNLRARIERSKTEYKTRGGETRFIWKPETERVRRVVIKNARGHALFEYGEPMLTEPEHVWIGPIGCMTEEERVSFVSGDEGNLAGWAGEIGSRTMTRVMTGQDLCDGWVVVQEGVYRFRVDQCGTLRVRSILHEYLATEVYWSDG